MAYQPVQQIHNTTEDITGTITAANQTVILESKAGGSCWTVQTVGTFVGSVICEASLDGITFVPIAYRQSQTGTLGNTIKTPGIYRGVIGGLYWFRVRATSWTSGSCTVYISTSTGSAAIFPNTVIETRNLSQYYASSAGGTTGFATSSGSISLNNSGGNVAILSNPLGSNINLYVNTFTFSANNPGRWERTRGVTVTPTGASQAIANRGGGANTTAVKLYIPSSATYTGGTLAEVTYLDAFNTYSERPEGAAIILPGQATAWNFYPDTSSLLSKNTSAAFSLTFWTQDVPST